MTEHENCTWLVERTWEKAFPFVANPEMSHDEHFEHEMWHWEGVSETAAESGMRYAIVDCGAEVSDVIRNGEIAGWQCEHGHSYIRHEFRTQQEDYEEMLADQY